MRKNALISTNMDGAPRAGRLPLTVLVLGVLACQPSGENPPEDVPSEPAPKPVVAMETSHGLIRMELEPELAPRSVENFLLHVRSQYYDGLTFYRVRSGFIIQGGELTPTLDRRVSPAAPIINEAENGLKNVRGAVAMARTGDPHSATSEFFINVADNAGLDFVAPTSTEWGYAVFGHVIEGMDVVDAIAGVSVRPRRLHGKVYEAVPEEPVVIQRAFIEEPSES